MSSTGRTEGLRRPIPEWDDYLAGDDGHIYSLKNWRSVPVRRLAEGRNRDGYPTVQLSPGVGSRTLVVAVHKLIARVWLGAKPSPRHEVRHLDGDKINNRPSNLAWGTTKQNAEDRDAHGRTARGERSGVAKLTSKQVLSIRERIASGETQTSIAASLGVCVATVNHIHTGRNWRHL